MIPSVPWNTRYLDKTKNCENRLAYTSEPYLFIVWHGTGGNPNNPEGTLKYNLINDGRRGSYHALVDKWGGIWAYLSSKTKVAWHAGVRSYWYLPAWEGKGGPKKGLAFKGHALNIWSIGIEIDELNTGVPITSAQLTSCAIVAINYHDRYGIPLAYPYHTLHKLVAPGYKHDATCTTVDQILTRAFDLLWGERIPVNWGFGIPNYWKSHYHLGNYLGEARTHETPARDGSTIQAFEKQAIRWKDGAGSLISLSDIATLTGGNP